ncbi:hypothetical protein JYT22_00595 [Endomicrobium sp. AH-315-J14]|nr:hypothetical protein [Endomicrobium sp. AH-315-J14]
MAEESDGSRERPWANISDAIDSSSLGGVVAIAEGNSCGCDDPEDSECFVLSSNLEAPTSE